MASIEIKSTDEECMYFSSINSLQMGRDSNTHNMVLIFDQKFHIEFDGGQSKACKSIYNLIRKNLKDNKKTIYIDSKDNQGWIANVFVEGDYKPIESSEPDNPPAPNIDIASINNVINNITENANDVNGEAKEVTSSEDQNTTDEVADYKEEVIDDSNNNDSSEPQISKE